MGRTEAVEYRGFCVVEIWELQNDLTAGSPFVPFVHMSGLHAADLHKMDLPQERWPRKVRRRFGQIEIGVPTEAFRGLCYPRSIAAADETWGTVVRRIIEAPRWANRLSESGS